MPRLAVDGVPTTAVEKRVEPAVRAREENESDAVNGVAGPIVPAPATMAVRATVPAKLLRLSTWMTDETATPTGASTWLGCGIRSKSGGGTVTTT